MRLEPQQHKQLVCVDSKETTNRIVELVTHEFPLAKLLVRSYDREHSLHLVKQKWTL